MFDLCSEVFTELDLPINISKCYAMLIGPRFNIACSALTIQGAVVPWVDSVKFLGVTICKSRSFSCSWDDAKRKFYCNSNAILGRLGTSAPFDELLKLINAQAVPNLIYGISAATLTTQEIKSLSYAYNSVFTKMFNTFDKNVIYCCQFYSGYLCFNMLYDLHRYTVCFGEIYCVKLLLINVEK